MLHSSQDPSEARSTEKVRAAVAAENTFEVMAREYLTVLEEQGSAKATMDKNNWLLLDLASPLHKKAIIQITSADILQLLRAVEKSGRRDTARRLRGVIGSVFRYAIVNLKAETDPTFALRGSLRKYKHKHRPAITDEAELGGLLVCIDEYDGWPCCVAFRAEQIFTPNTDRCCAVLGAENFGFDNGRQAFHLFVGEHDLVFNLLHNEFAQFYEQALAVLRGVHRHGRRQVEAHYEVTIASYELTHGR
jgi:hypothetical protein